MNCTIESANLRYRTLVYYEFLQNLYSRIECIDLFSIYFNLVLVVLLYCKNRYLDKLKVVANNERNFFYYTVISLFTESAILHKAFYGKMLRIKILNTSIYQLKFFIIKLKFFIIQKIIIYP